MDVGSQAAPKERAVLRPKVKIDALKPPSFDGDMLKYSEFKRTFAALLEQQGYSDEDASYI